jgi:hypothetical protein
VAVRGVDHQHVDAGLASSSTRSSVPSPTPTAAPTRSLPWASRAALGKSVCLVMSFTVIRPRSSKASLTTSTRSSLCWCISALPSSGVAPSRTTPALARRHDLAHRHVQPGLEAQVAVGDDAHHHLPSQHREARDAMLARQRHHLAHRVSGVTVIGSRSTPDS